MNDIYAFFVIQSNEFWWMNYKNQKNEFLPNKDPKWMNYEDITNFNMKYF